MVITVIPRIAIATVLALIAAFIYFTLALGMLEAFQGADFGYAFGQRVGFAASVSGAVFGALLALEVNWNRLKREDGSPAWVSRGLAILAVAIIVAVPLNNSGFAALSSLMHYGKLGLFSAALFYMGARFSSGLPD